MSGEAPVFLVAHPSYRCSSLPIASMVADQSNISPFTDSTVRLPEAVHSMEQDTAIVDASFLKIDEELESIVVEANSLKFPYRVSKSTITTFQDFQSKWKRFHLVSDIRIVWCFTPDTVFEGVSNPTLGLTSSGG